MTKFELEEKELDAVCGGSTEKSFNPLTKEQMDELLKKGKELINPSNLSNPLKDKLVEIGVDFLDKTYKELWDYFNKKGDPVDSANNIGCMFS